jgi:hypothetical protein
MAAFSMNVFFADVLPRPERHKCMAIPVEEKSPGLS